jgi:uncharacterized RDD family membrane protein YckC
MTVTMNQMDDYVRRVVDRMPSGTPQRSQIERELKSTITERLEQGQPIDHVLRQLGDPAVLAQSYLAEVPLVAGSIGARFLAKLIDVAFVVAAVAPFAWFAGSMLRAFTGSLEGGLLASLFIEGIAVGLLFGLYTAIAEWRYGKTVGKHVMGLRVVDESGAQIGLGQALVRQLAQVANIFWIDAFFALFTTHQQRAFELLSKTRVVVV